MQHLKVLTGEVKLMMKFYFEMYYLEFLWKIVYVAISDFSRLRKS